MAARAAAARLPCFAEGRLLATRGSEGARGQGLRQGWLLKPWLTVAALPPPLLGLQPAVCPSFTSISAARHWAV